MIKYKRLEIILIGMDKLVGYKIQHKQNLKWYNPLVMSKMFLMNDARIMDQFNSQHLYWIDAGITNTIHPGYFTHDKIQNKLPELFDKFGHLFAFPYDANNEIHGFSYPKINSYAGDEVKLVCRGGLFGGPKHVFSDINGIYYNILSETLRSGLWVPKNQSLVLCYINIVI
jgi:hypothetical protein